jgi:hypothetical protein
MNKILLLSALLLFSLLRVSGQSPFNNATGISYFESGTELLKNGNIVGSDSLLTLALCTYKNENVYVNRGIARLYNNDTLGFCEDFWTASYKYLDFEASRLYYSICCKKVDTIFYDKNFLPVTNSKFKYYEVFSQSPYTRKSIGFIHQKGARSQKVISDYGCNDTLTGLEIRFTDIIAIYELVDTVKYYTLTPTPIKISNSFTYAEINKNASNYLRSKYDNIKKQSDGKEVSVSFSITFSNTGETLGIECLGISPIIDIEEIKPELEKDILQLVMTYPKATPATFMKEKVFFKTIASFTF